MAKVNSIKELRNTFKANPMLKIEFLASISRLLRENSIEADASLFSDITVCSNAELSVSAASIDPPSVATPMIDPASPASIDPPSVATPMIDPASPASY
jgi:hypothetical protein